MTNRGRAVVAVLGIAVAAGVFLLIKGGDDDSDSSSNGAQKTSVDQLHNLADVFDHPIYWAGERSGTELELTVDDTGNVYVRYIDSSEQVGTRNRASLTVGTYPGTNTYSATQEIAGKPGARTGQTPDGGLVVSDPSNPTSTYIAYRGGKVQIEVFDPDPDEGFTLATSGDVVPVP